MTRAVKFTATSKQVTFYSDFGPNLDLNPITAQIAVATNENAVGQALKGLILTNIGERFYHPEIGSKVQGLNFEPNDESTLELLKTTITQTINNCEPRVQLQDLQVKQDIDHNAIYITIFYSLINITGTFKTVVPIRVR
jgi:phage baseplate assembly protein W